MVAVSHEVHLVAGADAIEHFGDVEFRVTEGTQLRVDGSLLGPTPLPVKRLPLGRLLGKRRYDAPWAETTVTSIASATVAFRFRPFATVIIDGHYVGDTPIDALTLPVGTVDIVLINKDLGKEVWVAFEVRPGPNVFKDNPSE